MNQLRRPKYIGEEQLERTIRIRLSDTCNFSCSYCIEHDTLPKEYNHMKQYDMIMVLENLKKLYEIDQRTQKLFIWGGEPTLNINLIWFLNRIRSEYKFITEIEIHSNLSSEFGPNFFDTMKELGIMISSSIHLEYKSKRTTANILTAYGLGILKEVNLMLSKFLDYDEVIKIKEYYLKKHKDFPISIVPTFQLQDIDLKRTKLLINAAGQWQDRPIDGSDTNRNYIEVRNEVNLNSYICNVPKDSFIINTNGIVFLCQNDLIAGVPTKINFFTELHRNVLETFLGQTKCSYDKCDCEHIILKIKN